MKDTIFKNVYFMYPQDRNLHGNIFGGHILRRAFEAARVTASIFFGTEDKVAFKAVDEIHFVKPIPVGCIVEFTSTVTYSEMNVCVINVRAATIDVTSGVKDTTNSFNYMFYVPMKYVSLDNTTDDATIQRSGVDIKQTSCAIMENGIDTATVETLQSPSSNCIQRMKLPKVVPREYYEIVQYLEGRRSLRHMLNETNKSNISSARFAQLVSKS